ncbi:serine/threonine protein kinase [Streptomyces bathyalis]|uniref:Serine/threonine protein kinase n=1 Tax=Streptomyces bathyalis TaxID=2710756 RepID=A0A7T1T5Y1_9ACTN|nr:serine/threonine protein kinase [Streptomyces bathyalis]QPP06952.1 serine/threonine protein kinase [Streptomyces bathyalis]
MDDYADKAGRLLADRYRLPRTTADSHQLTESVAYDTASGQEVLVRQVPLPEIVEAEVLEDGGSVGAGAAHGAAFRGSIGRATRSPADPAVRRAVEAAVAAARLPDHPRLDQVFDVFVEGDGLWIVSELLPATPLATLLSHQTLTAHRAAEIAADLLTALRVVHAHGWTHRNVTAHTVLICDDGRALLTGLAVGAAQEALCGYSPLPDSERVALPPSGNIPGEPRRSSGGGSEAETAGEQPQSGAGSSPESESWKGITLPEGFDVRQEDQADDPYGRGPVQGGGDDPGQGPARAGGSPRGIFGLQGLGHDGPPAEQGSGPVRHGYETGGRGPRSGAVAAYQAGAKRGAAARVHGAERDEPEPARQESGPGDEAGAREDWWNRPASAPPADTRHATPDDYVRWFPAGEDEVTPSDLPGSRPPNSLPVKATWRPAEPEPRPEQERGGRPEGSLYSDVPYAEEMYGGSSRSESRYSDPYDSDAHDSAPYDSDAYDEDPYADEPESRPWGGEGAEENGAPEGFRGPATALAAERARQARMTVVGAVSERWAPEQAGPVHQNWRLAPPVGPSADLWALGVLLFRAVQGHAPYPEDDVAELVQMVCGEPPAFAEECGPLRPVVESLLRQDPTERPDFEELRGWLRSLVRSAPEPEVGWHTVYAPSLDPGGTSDPRRLPILRRRGELVRRRRAARRAARAEQRQQHRHQQREQRRQKQQRPRPAPLQGAPHASHPQAPHDQTARLQAQQPPQPGPVPPMPQQSPEPRRERAAHRRSRPAREKKPRQGAGPRKLGGILVGLVLAGLAAALMYAVWFMPEGDTNGASNQQRGSVGGESRPPEAGDGSGNGGGDGGGDGGGSGEKQQPPAAGKAPKGYKLSQDPAGFRVAVPDEWNRRSTTGRGQVRYNGGEVEMVIVNGRDAVGKYGKDPMAYQSDDEPELKAYRASDWASTSGLRRIDVGETAMAEGTFSWKDGGRDIYARNRAMILDGRYHVLMVMGSKGKKQEIDRHFEAVADTYRSTGR